MRRLFLGIFFIIPVIAVIFFISSAFRQGNTGFKVDKTQNGFLVSKITKQVNQVQLGDMVVSVHGISYHRVLGYALTRHAMPKKGFMTVLRDDRLIELPIKTIPYTVFSLTSLIWPRLILMLIFLSTGGLVIYRAPPSHTKTLFYLMLCSLSTSLAATMPSTIVFIDPFTYSCSFLLHAPYNWISFGLWVHFALRFPESRDLLQKRPWVPFCIYLFPAVTTFGGAFIAAGITPEYWGWVQRLRNLYLPMCIVGVFIKHSIDYRVIQDRQEKNQIMLPLIAYWLTFSPYLFLYLLPNILLDSPLISFRLSVFAFFILPLAYYAAILRYKLFEVDQIISRTIAYICIIAGLSVIYSFFFTALRKWFFGEQVLSKEIFLIFLVVMNLISHPVILKLDKLIRRLFFKDDAVSVKAMHNLSNYISATLNLSDIIQAIVKQLPRVTRIRLSAVVVFDKEVTRLFPEDFELDKRPRRNGRLAHAFKDNTLTHIDLSQKTYDPSMENLLEDIRKRGFSLILPLKSPQAPLSGMLLVGPKESGGLYSDQDIHLLASFANQAAISLENAIHYDSLIKSKQQLEELFDQKVQSEKMAAIGEMTAMLAHELKNPLGIIHSSAQYLSEGRSSKEVTDEMLHYIKNEVEHLTLSINSILTLARQKTPEFEKTNIAGELEQMVEQWKRTADHNPQVSIRLHIMGDIPLVYADARQLSQVFLNIIRNSEEIMDDGGDILVEAGCGKDYVFIHVTDNGPGITEEDVDKVFLNFFTTKKNGLGLGLAVSKQIVGAHNGSISMANRNEPGQTGAVVRVELPLVPLSHIDRSGFIPVKQGI